MNSLIIIPARGGSKSIPFKNIMALNGKPLIHYSLEYARLFTTDDNICLTTDEIEIAQCAAEIGYQVPFIRPAWLATDTAGTFDVIKHAMQFYGELGKTYEVLVLIQPTSPIRAKFHLEEALKIYTSDLDMVVSVYKPKENPYYSIFEEDAEGYLRVSKGTGAYQRRQDIPPVYAMNGSLYIINPKSIQFKNSFTDFAETAGWITIR